MQVFLILLVSQIVFISCQITTNTEEIGIALYNNFALLLKGDSVVVEESIWVGAGGERDNKTVFYFNATIKQDKNDYTTLVWNNQAQNQYEHFVYKNDKPIASFIRPYNGKRGYDIVFDNYKLNQCVVYNVTHKLYFDVGIVDIPFTYQPNYKFEAPILKNCACRNWNTTLQFDNSNISTDTEDWQALHNGDCFYPPLNN